MKRLLLAAATAAFLYASPAHALERQVDLAQGTAFGDESLDVCLVSGDGSTAVFTDDESHSAADTDSSTDVYVVRDGAPVLVSDRVRSGVDSEAPVQCAAVSHDGSRIFMHTVEPLTDDDGDLEQDVYEHSGGVVRIVSDRVQAGSDAALPASLEGTSADGSRVFFRTTEPLLGGDGDSAADIYERSGAATRLRSDRVRTGADAAEAVTLENASQNGKRIVIRTREPLTDDDGDAAFDLYSVVDDRIPPADVTLLSDRVQTGADTADDVEFHDATADGSVVAWATGEPVVAADADIAADVYTTSDGTTTLASDRPAGAEDGSRVTHDAKLSDDGAVVFFETGEALLPGSDDDLAIDVYAFSAGVTTLLSDRVRSGPDAANNATLADVSGGQGQAIVLTREPLTDDDDDIAGDLYDATSGTALLLSDRRQPGADAETSVEEEAVWPGRVGWVTDEPLVAADGDGAQDVYVVEGGELVLASDRRQPGPDAEENALPFGSSADGSVIAFSTREPLTAADSNTRLDDYLSRPVPPPPPPAQPDPPPAPPSPGAGAPGAAPQAPVTPVDALAPQLGRLSIPKRVTLGKTATIKFTSSEAARGTLVVERVTCKKKSRRARRCTKKFKRVGKPTTLDARAGANTVRFKPARGFKAGAHRLRLNAVDGAGNKSAERRADFTLVKPKAKKKR
jgi:hypothetical protein